MATEAGLGRGFHLRQCFTLRILILPISNTAPSIILYPLIVRSSKTIFVE